MHATVLHAPGDVRFEEVPEPKILKPTDAIIKLAMTCIYGSNLWPYSGLQPVERPQHMGHEYCGTVVEVGGDGKTIKPGQFVIGSFATSDNTCPHCRCGFQYSCEQREFMSGALRPRPARRRHAGRHGRRSRRRSAPQSAGGLGRARHRLARGRRGRVQSGATVAVVGDGAVGLMGVLAVKQMGAERIIAMSCHKARQELALECGVTERGDAGVAWIKEMTGNVGADAGAGTTRRLGMGH